MAEDEQKRVRRGAEAAVFVDKMCLKKFSNQVIFVRKGKNPQKIKKIRDKLIKCYPEAGGIETKLFTGISLSL